MTGGDDDGGTTGATGGSAGGQVNLVMWMGYTPPPPEADSLEYLSIERMVTEFEASHPERRSSSST